jgi:hypothetical protein
VICITIKVQGVINTLLKSSYLPGIKTIDMKRRIEKVIKAVKGAILDLFQRKVSVLPLQLTRGAEKFDSVTRPPFAGGIGDRTKPH